MSSSRPDVLHPTPHLLLATSVQRPHRMRSCMHACLPACSLLPLVASQHRHTISLILNNVLLLYPHRLSFELLLPLLSPHSFAFLVTCRTSIFAVELCLSPQPHVYSLDTLSATHSEKEERRDQRPEARTFTLLVAPTHISEVLADTPRLTLAVPWRRKRRRPVAATNGRCAPWRSS